MGTSLPCASLCSAKAKEPPRRSLRARKQKQLIASLTLETNLLSTNLKISNHHQASCIGATSDEGCCVHPGGLSLLQELPVAQEADDGHWEGRERERGASNRACKAEGQALGSLGKDIPKNKSPQGHAQHGNQNQAHHHKP